VQKGRGQNFNSARNILQGGGEKRIPQAKKGYFNSMKSLLEIAVWEKLAGK